MAGPQPANPRPVDLLQLEDVNNPKGVGGEEAKTEEETKTVVCQLALRRCAAGKASVHMFAKSLESLVLMGRTESLHLAPPPIPLAPFVNPAAPNTSTHPDPVDSTDTIFSTAMRVEQLPQANNGIALLFQVVYDAVANSSRQSKPAAEVQITFQSLFEAATNQCALHFPLKFELPSKRSGSSDPELLIKCRLPSQTPLSSVKAASIKSPYGSAKTGAAFTYTRRSEKSSKNKTPQHARGKSKSRDEPIKMGQRKVDLSFAFSTLQEKLKSAAITIFWGHSGEWLKCGTGSASQQYSPSKSLGTGSQELVSVYLPSRDQLPDPELKFAIQLESSEAKQQAVGEVMMRSSELFASSNPISLKVADTDVTLAVNSRWESNTSSASFLLPPSSEPDLDKDTLSEGTSEPRGQESRFYVEKIRPSNVKGRNGCAHAAYSPRPLRSMESLDLAAASHHKMQKRRAGSASRTKSKPTQPLRPVTYANPHVAKSPRRSKAQSPKAKNDQGGDGDDQQVLSGPEAEAAREKEKSVKMAQRLAAMSIKMKKLRETMEETKKHDFEEALQEHRATWEEERKDKEELWLEDREREQQTWRQAEMEKLREEYEVKTQARVKVLLERERNRLTFDKNRVRREKDKAEELKVKLELERKEIIKSKERLDEQKTSLNREKQEVIKHAESRATNAIRQVEIKLATLRRESKEQNTLLQRKLDETNRLNAVHSTRMKNTLSTTEADVTNMQKQLDITLSENDALQKNLDAAKDFIQKLKAQSNSANSKIASLEAAQEGSQKEHKDSELQLAKERENSTKLLARVKELESLNTTLKTENQKRSKKSKTLEAAEQLQEPKPRSYGRKGPSFRSSSSSPRPSFVNSKHLQPKPPGARPRSSLGVGDRSRGGTPVKPKKTYKSRRSFAPEKTSPEPEFSAPFLVCVTGSSPIAGAGKDSRALPVVASNPPPVVAHTNPGTDSGDVTAASPRLPNNVGKVSFAL